MKMSKLSLFALLTIGAYLFLKIVVPVIGRFLHPGAWPLIPASLLKMYMLFIIVTILLYLSSKEEDAKALMAPIKATLTDPSKRMLRNIIFAVIPLLAAYITYGNVAPSYDAPVELRSIHPAPPSRVNVFNKSYDLLTLKNPLRDDTANYAKYVKEGGELYFKNCFFCHGDKLDGKGHFYQGFDPQPLPFMGTDTIAQLSESFVFWRASTGGPGLPKEGAPWRSAMPIWEHFLSEEEIWKVSMFIYDYSGNKPRTF